MPLEPDHPDPTTREASSRLERAVTWAHDLPVVLFVGVSRPRATGFGWSLRTPKSNTDQLVRTFQHRSGVPDFAERVRYDLTNPAPGR
jgi:hypothetical protein